MQLPSGFRLPERLGNFGYTSSVQVSVPEDSGGHRSQRPELIAEYLGLLLRRTAVEFESFLNGNSQRKIADRPDVRSPERVKQIDIGGPWTDSLDLCQDGSDIFVRPLFECLEIENTRADEIGHYPAIRNFLTTEADAPKLFIGQR